MGFRNVGEMIGRSDMLRVDESALHSKTKTLDLGPILTPASVLAPGEEQVNTITQDHFSPDATGLEYYGSDVTTKGYEPPPSTTAMTPLGPSSPYLLAPPWPILPAHPLDATWQVQSAR